MNTNADIDGGRGELDGDGYGAAIFGCSTFGQSGRVQATIGFQRLDVDSAVNIDFVDAIAPASTDVDVTFAAIQADCMMLHGAVNWGPIGSLEYYRVTTDAFTETCADAWNVSVGAQTDEVTITTAGVRANISYSSAGGWEGTPFGHLPRAGQQPAAGRSGIPRRLRQRLQEPHCARLLRHAFLSIVCCTIRKGAPRGAFSV